MFVNGEHKIPTREEAIELHRKMWNEIPNLVQGSERRGDYKEKWLSENGYWGVYNDCFLCEYTAAIADYQYGPDCSECPLLWGCEDNQDDFFCENKLDKTMSWINRDAKEVANLPERI